MITRIISLLFTLIPITSFANSELLSEQINKVLNENNEVSKTLNIAIQVNELSSGHEIYSERSDQHMIPASTTKIFTAYVALDFLGPNFSYKTSLYFDKSKIKSDGTLDGDLYLKFEGDPSLTLNDFTNLLSQLKQYEISSINGNIIIDDLIFDQYYQADGWPWDDAKFCFAAPTSAIVIDKNCFHLNLIPGKKIDETSKLEGFSSANITNQIITKDDPKCSPVLFAKPDNSYNLTNCLDINSPHIPLKIAYQNPRIMIENLIRKLAPRFKGNVIFSQVPETFEPIIKHNSAPISELVKVMMKNSENIYADNFLKTIGAKYYNTQGNFSNGTKAIQEITHNSKIRIFDGSGGSTYNLINPEAFIELLQQAYKNQKIWPYLYESFAISSIDGTLHSRFPNLETRIRAKTGSIKSVVNLVGFIENKDKKLLAFAIMINGVMDKKQATELLDRILETIAKNS